MENFVKKVIRASAGTGKTYRLSLEYIGLLLKFHQQGIHFSEILVITFTKKATGEIRDRIFSHLKEITEQTEQGRALCENLNSILNVRVTPAELEVLRSYYHNMLMNKDQVQISTIDAFTQKIFSTIIAPFLGITNFEIKNQISDEQFSELYQTILDEQSLKLLKEFFRRTGRRNIEGYKNLVKSVINDRWLFHFIENHARPRVYDQVPDDYAETKLANFRTTFFNVLDEFQYHIAHKKKSLSVQDVLKGEIYELFFRNHRDATIFELSRIIKEKLNDESFLIENQKVLFAKTPFWNKKSVSDIEPKSGQHVDLEEELQSALDDLAEFIFYKQLLPEEQEIKEICRRILARYDEIKFREKVFTYSDISYYTFKYLYHPELSLIDRDYVSNSFYEYLSTYTRFVLIDEFQDTSIVQFKILLPIIKEVISGVGAKEYGGAIVVGDEKQSIYGWRGGERDLLLNIPRILADPQEVVLNTSYRSDENVLNFHNEIFSAPTLHSGLKKKEINWFYENVIPYHKNNAGYIRVNFRNYSSGKNNVNDISQEQDAIREFIAEILQPLVENKELSLQGTAILARRNNDLQYIANVLDEFAIDYILESSTSILHHRTVKPILFLFRFLLHRDVFDLLRFLRSDLVLMNTKDLKEVLLTHRDFAEKEFNIQAYFDRLNHVAAINKLSRFIEKSFHEISTAEKPFVNQHIDLLNFTKNLLEEYNVTGVFNLENDIKNLNFFIEIISTFEKMNRDYPNTLQGFIAFCEEMETDESFQQLGLENLNAINLLSIHKAKGLEFDNVFLYWNLTSRAGNSYGQLNSYLEYDADYNQLRNYLLTYNYDYIVPLSQSRGLKQQKEIRKAIEELNTFYVATTRAKSNLFLFFAYKKSEGLGKLLQDIERTENPSIIKLLGKSVYEVFFNKGLLEVEDQNRAHGEMGKLVIKKEDEEISKPKEFSFIKQYLDPDRSKYLMRDDTKIEREKQIDYKRVYLDERTVEKGNVVHYYLSFIKFNTEQEKQFAAAKTIAYYGGLVPVSEIKELIEKVNKFIARKADLFSPQKWDKVFTEYTIFSSRGQEFRLDRLMIDEKNKEIMIIDYKTGDIYDEKQIENYINIVRSLKIVTEGGYKVYGKFEEVL